MKADGDFELDTSGDLKLESDTEALRIALLQQLLPLTGSGVRWADRETIESAVGDVMRKHLEGAGFEDTDIRTQTLWQSMPLWKRAAWRLLRVWPLSIAGARARNRVDAENRARWAALTPEQRDAGEYETIEYPAIFHPHPRAVILFSMKLRAPINSCNVVAEISV